ncbi:MAG TPA: nuclear transport factor 2 family protein [Steroidobacteraceae bacterium]|nr:nuclear transport factor 2 family protein [Steroidobacteraceae bacterium]
MMRSSNWRAAGILISLPALLCACGGQPGNNKDMQRVSALEQQIAGLESEVVRVQDVSDIKRLQRAYGYYLDAAAWDQMADLFADDATFEIGLDGVYVGQERIRQYLHTLGGGRLGLQQGQLNEHMQLQPVIDVAADGLSARGRWRAFIMAGQYHRSALWGEGPYENEYVKQNGVWKISKLHWYQTFLVPYAGGWAQNKDVNAGVFVSKSLPPDRPPSEHYGTWPGVYIPPFHYHNPVTGR